MESINILHVEDDPDDAFFLRNALLKAEPRCEIQRVVSGEQAVEYLCGAALFADRQRYPTPQLVVLDLKLPGMSGFDVLDWARAQAPLRELPIVVLSGSALEGDRERARKLRASAYLVKSSVYREIVTAIVELLPEGPPGLS